jgi:hypothetical protein
LGYGVRGGLRTVDRMNGPKITVKLNSGWRIAIRLGCAQFEKQGLGVDVIARFRPVGRGPNCVIAALRLGLGGWRWSGTIAGGERLDAGYGRR